MSPSLSSSFSTGRALFLLQLSTRLLTFILNQALVRLAPPEALGTAAIQFDLVAATILFLSREGVRNALLREPETGRSQDKDKAKGEKTGTSGEGDKTNLPNAEESEKQNSSTRSGFTNQAEFDPTNAASIRLAQLPFHLSLLVTPLILLLYLLTSSSSTVSQPSFHLSLGLYVASALAELAIEPWYVRSLRGRLGVRIQAEGGAASVKAIATVGWLVLDPVRYIPGSKGGGGGGGGGGALLAFAVGQTAGAAWLVGRYVVAYGFKGLVWTRTPKGEKRYDPRAFKLAMANARQAVVKHVLTEADRIAVGQISPLGDQGGYAVAINYGSLIARIIFQPLEETLLLHFSASPPSTNPSSIPFLTYILHISSHLLLFLPCFLPPLLPPLLPLLLPRRYAFTSAASTLKTYLSWYIPLMSVNGILEAFHAATATPEQVARQARWMIASSGAFAIGLFGLTRWSNGKGKEEVGNTGFNLSAWVAPPTTEQALVYASCIAMVVRIVYAFLHARRVAASAAQPSTTPPSAKGITISRVVPKLATIAISLVSGVILRVAFARLAAQPTLSANMTHLALGGVLGVSTLLVTAFVERRDYYNLQSMLRSKTE